MEGKGLAVMVLWKEVALPRQGSAKVQDDVQESDVRRIYRDESAQQEIFQSGWAPLQSSETPGYAIYRAIHYFPGTGN
jgi:hypothetical protein